MQEKVYYDRNGKLLEAGDVVDVKYCIGRYGQTRMVRGILKSIDNFGGVAIYLSSCTEPFNVYFQGFTAKTLGPGDEHYIAIKFNRVDGKLIGYHEHHDFEHGHETWIEKQEETE